MDTIRTTITIPLDLHEELRLQSIKERKSLGRLVTEKFKERVKVSKKMVDIDKRIRQDFKLFDLAAKSSIKLDAAVVVRQERDRNNV